MQIDWPLAPLSSFLVDVWDGKIDNYQFVDSLPTNLRSCLIVCWRVKFLWWSGSVLFLQKFVNVKGRPRTVNSYAAGQKVSRFSGTPRSISSLQETCLEPCSQDNIFNVYILYNVRSLLDASCNLLDYWRHRSVCYTSLFATPLVVVTISLLQWVLTLWCLVSERSLDLFSVLSSISVCPECWQLTDWLTILCLSICVCRSLNPVFAYRIEYILSQGLRFPC
jgi:hypothetical protein